MLDLDALERITKEPGFRGFDWMERRLMGDGHYSIIQHRVDGIPALIQRLREAEYDRDVIAPANATDVDAILAANQRLQARIAQLELVRSAAMLLLRTGTSSYAIDPKYWIGVTVQTFSVLKSVLADLEDR